jgi:hypothetical protein
MPQQFMSMAAQKPGVEGEAAAAAALSPGGGGGVERQLDVEAMYYRRPSQQGVLNCYLRCAVKIHQQYEAGQIFDALSEKCLL